MYRSTCAFHRNVPNFFLSNGCHVESKREVVVAYMLYALQAFLIVSSAAIGLHARCLKNHLGFRVQEHVKEKVFCFQLQFHLVWICGTAEVVDSPFCVA